MKQIFPVILCGGSGTRLWPKSRPSRPKPFHRLVGEATLFEQALARLRGDLFAPPLIVAGAGHVDLISAGFSDAQPQQLIVEPSARNTAPAIALAAAHLDPEAVMVVCPSDHHIADQAAFHDAIASGAQLASSDWLVTLGINPTGPETGFGYIERGNELGGGAFHVRRFVEKPDLRTAETFLESGEFSWNSGIFLFKAGVYLEHLALHRPAMADAVARSIAGGEQAGRLFHPAPLPRFGGAGMYGLRVHDAVLGAGLKETEVTVHFVDEEYDSGDVIARWPVPVYEGDTAELLAERVLKVEHVLFPRVLDMVACLAPARLAAGSQ